MGSRMRLTTKPGSSCERTTSFPSRSAKAVTRSVVSCAVARPGITSIRPMTGTGLKKCSPMKRAGSGDQLAIRVIGMELVLLARMAFSPSTLLTFSKMPCLIASFSVAASMIMSACAMGARSPTGLIRPSVAEASPASILPLSTSLPSARSIPPSAFSAIASSRSVSSTSIPLWAMVCAMPEPIWPAPMTPMVCMMILVLRECSNGRWLARMGRAG